MSNKKTCETCRCWQEKDSEHRVGECRANPPSPYILPDDAGKKVVHWLRPVTPHDGWCGQHQPRESL